MLQNMAGRGRRHPNRNGASGSGASEVEPEPEPVAPNPDMTAVLQLLQRQQQQMQQLQEQVLQLQRERDPPPPPAPHHVPQEQADLPPPPPYHPPPVDHLLEQFLKLRAPTFSGASGADDPAAFLEEMQKRFRAMGYYGPRRVDLVEFVLEGRAQVWYSNVRRSRPAGAAPLSWEEFEELFMGHFLSETTRMSRAYEFERLTHAACGSVEEYASKFMELSVYAPGLIATEKQKVDRFLYGLRKDIRRAVVGQRCASLTEAIDIASRVELWDTEEEVEQRKKVKVDFPPPIQRGPLVPQ